MNILFISTLYPSQPLESNESITLALHNLVKCWNQAEDVNILVIRPVFLYLREIFKKKTFFRKKMITIDNVRIIVYPIFKIPKIAYFYYPLYRYLDKYFKSIGFEPDIVAAHYDKSLVIGFQYSRMKHLPFVAGFHATPDLMENNPGDFTKRCAGILEAASVIACRSFYIYNKIRGWFPRYHPKCFVAFSGLDEKLIEDKKFALAKLKQWKKQGKVLILSVSSLIDLKNVDVNLKALAQLKDKIDWTYTIIGEGKERPNLEALVLQLGIRDRVRFMGAKAHKEVIEEMKRSHIFVLVSFLETFGLVYLEALAAGNIIIGSRDEGIDGVIENAKNGFLSPAGEVEPLKNLLEKIIIEYPEQKLEKILIEANRTIRQYTEKNAAQNYLKQLKKLKCVE